MRAAPGPGPPGGGKTEREQLERRRAELELRERELERLLDERGTKHLERLEECELYLVQLRRLVGADGALGESVKRLVQDVSAELLAPPPLDRPG